MIREVYTFINDSGDSLGLHPSYSKFSGLTSILLLPWPSGWVERRLCQEDGESLKLTEVVCMPPELTPLLSVRAGDITWRSSASDPHLVTVGEATANDVKMREVL